MRQCTLCEKKHYARGYCKNHYMLWWKKGTPNRENAKNKGMICKIRGCNSVAHAKGTCVKHYTRWLKHGSCKKKVYKGIDNWCWKGGKSQYPGHYTLKKNRLIKLKQVNNKCEDCSAFANKVIRKDGDNSNHEITNLKAVCQKCFNKNTISHGKSKYKNSVGRVADLAIKMGVSEYTIYKRLKQGLFPSGSGRHRGRPKKIT